MRGLIRQRSRCAARGWPADLWSYPPSLHGGELRNGLPLRGFVIPTHKNRVTLWSESPKSWQHARRRAPRNRGPAGVASGQIAKSPSGPCQWAFAAWRRRGGGIFSLTSAAAHVLVAFMSAAAEVPAPTTEPSRSGRLLDLVRKLIDYGRELATTIRQRGATDPNFTTGRFGTLDPVSILARIINGLLRADALEARVLRRAAHLDAGPRPTTARFAAAKTPVTTPAVPPPAAAPVDPGLARLPTPAQIATAVRCQPIGAVIADI